MNKIVLFAKNFSPEYKDYIITKIPYKYGVEVNKKDYYISFLFNKDTFGYIYGSKHDEDLEKIKFNWTFKNEPHTMDVDDLNEFLIKL